MQNNFAVLVSVIFFEQIGYGSCFGHKFASPRIPTGGQNHLRRIRFPQTTDMRCNMLKQNKIQDKNSKWPPKAKKVVLWPETAWNKHSCQTLAQSKQLWKTGLFLQFWWSFRTISDCHITFKLHQLEFRSMHFYFWDNWLAPPL